MKSKDKRYDFNEHGFNRVKPTIKQSITAFIRNRKIINININLFLFRLQFNFPAEHDWFNFSTVLLQLITFGITMAYGCGWGIGGYKRETSFYFSIHAKRVIIYLDLGINYSWFIQLKTDWITYRMSDSERREVAKMFSDLLKDTK